MYNKVNHRIPHRLERVTNLSPMWCGHCGQLIRITNKMDRCAECPLAWHPECSVFTPDFCGLSISKAYDIYSGMMHVLSAKERLKSMPSGKVSLATPSKSNFNLELKKKEASISSILSSSEKLKQKKKKKVTIDHFHFLSVLGKGNFGKVMLSEEKETGKLYAIKVLKKEFIIENDEVERYFVC